MAGGKSYISFSRVVNESVKFYGKAYAFLPIHRSSVEAINSKVTLKKLIHINRENKEITLGNITASKNIFFNKNISENINSKLYVGKLIFINNKIGNEKFLNNVHAGKTIDFQRIGSTIISNHTSASLTNYKTVDLDITIPAGGEIRIDSDIFTAIMGQENILYAYKGDFITFEKNTIQIIVDSGTKGKLVGEIIYNERYI